MSPTFERRVHSARLGLLMLAAVAAAGVAIGWLLPSGKTVGDYAHAVIHAGCFGAVCIIAARQGGRGRFAPLLLLIMFLLDILRGPHVPILSGLGLAAGVAATVASLRGHQRFTLGAGVLCSVLLAATLIGGLILQQ